ncbi:MAG: response regulator transcription factor [Undibacterium umbellatum]|uniref:response regulator n=1 Tax=Undibacterium umbellatum TaxID=2762300 RepID=UPI003BB6A9C7
MKKNALIIEDHPFYSDALSLFLREHFGLEQIKIVTSTEEAINQVKQAKQIGLIMLDLGLPGVKGVDAVSILKRHYPDAVIVIISASDERREIDAVLKAGATAFISKSLSNIEVKAALGKILSGDELDSRNFSLNKGDTEYQQDNLTDRQSEVLALLCQGLSNKEICLRLNVAEVTVKIHVSAIFRALGVFTRTQAVLAAKRIGYAHLNSP